MARYDHRIGVDQHTLVAGNTGSGKTVHTRVYLSQFPKVVMLDVKGDTSRTMKRGEDPWPEIDKRDLLIVHKLSDLIANERDYRFIIYEPDHDEINHDAFNAFFRWCYEREDITVWVDEVFAVAPNPHKIPEYFQAILTRGRTRNVAAWCLTQRPVGIPKIIFTQCSHNFIYNLKSDTDRQAVADAIGCPEFEENPGKYQFWYANDTMDHAVLGRLELGREVK